jgi:hypothetical protein
MQLVKQINKHNQIKLYKKIAQEDISRSRWVNVLKVIILFLFDAKGAACLHPFFWNRSACSRIFNELFNFYVGI